MMRPAMDMKPLSGILFFIAHLRLGPLSCVHVAGFGGIPFELSFCFFLLAATVSSGLEISGQ